MLTSKKDNLKTLIRSQGGVHLTIYLENRGRLLELKSQLREALEEAEEWLSSALTTEEKERFLEPIESLLTDPKIFKQMRGNIGVFRNQQSFRILNIPIDIEHSCQVATSFHVKPLLRWLQGDREFLLLGFEKDAAHLYQGSLDSFKLVDTILFPDIVSANSAVSFGATFEWINTWLDELTKTSRPKLFVAGEPLLVQAFNQNLKYKNAVKTPVSARFAKSVAIELCQQIRKILKVESQKSIERALLEFKWAEEDNRAKKNIFQISRAVVKGKVRKLIVTDELSIFGKIDLKTGGLAIHPFDLDHEDDCILDDLAQMVLSQGGEVIVAKRSEIPKGRPILAILDDEGESLAKTEGRQKLESVLRPA